MNYTFEANTVGYLYYNGVNHNYNFVPNKYYVDQLKELKDNRLFSTCSLIPFGKTQAEAGVTDEDLKNFDKYQGMPLGIESADVNTWNKVCCFYNPSLTQVTSTFPIITASRMLLIEAEAAQRGWIQADPAQLYAAGVKASLNNGEPKVLMNIWHRKQLLIRVLMLIKLIKLLFSAGSVASWLMVLRHGLTGVVLIFRN